MFTFLSAESIQHLQPFGILYLVIGYYLDSDFVIWNFFALTDILAESVGRERRRDRETWGLIDRKLMTTFGS